MIFERELLKNNHTAICGVSDRTVCKWEEEYENDHVS